MDPNAPREFPDSIEYGDLKKTHADYNPPCPLTGVGLLDKYDDLYNGGCDFRRRIENYLVKRAIEQASPGPKMANAGAEGLNPKSEGSIKASAAQKVQGNAGANQWAARKKRAWYTPFVSFIIDFIVAAVNQNSPAIIDPSALVSKGADGTSPKISDEKMKYWHQLNENVDGAGKDMAVLGRDAIQEILIHNRSYLYVSFPKVAAQSVGEQEKSGGLDGRIDFWGARFVDDWECDAKGNLVWVRTHSKSAVRSEPWKQPDSEHHIWTYITASGLYKYEITFKTDEAPKDTSPIAGAAPEFHSHDALPVIPIRVKKGLHVMDRLADTVLALFNRQSAATWTLDQMAFALLIIFSEKAAGAISAADICALQLDPADKAEFKAPDAAIFDAQQKDIERLKGELFSVIHMMALQAEKDKGGNPASGSAKEMDMGGMKTLLSAFASPERDALEQAVRIIKKMRGELDVPLALKGLDNFDVQSLEKKLANAKSYLNLSQELPTAAKKSVIADVSLAMCPDAPPDVKKQIYDETMALKEIKPEPALTPAAKPPPAAAA